MHTVKSPKLVVTNIRV